MNTPKCDEWDYLHFLIAAQRVFTCTEAARCQPEGEDSPAHDAFTRLLAQEPPNTETLWQEAQGFVDRKKGLLVIDDTTLDKPYARKMALVTSHWSGKHHRVVAGINVETLLWTQGGALIPTDFRVYNKSQDHLTKNDHFQAMLAKAKERGFSPEYVGFDSWYASIANLKQVRSYGWHWFTRLKHNRLVYPDGTGKVAIEALEIPPEGREVSLREVSLKDYGMARVFRIVATDGDVEYWATSDLSMTEASRKDLAKRAWGIETYHRVIKQCCGIERSQVRGANGQRNHLLYALRAFLRLEAHRLRTGISWDEAKTAIIRDAVRDYVAHPRYLLATA